MLWESPLQVAERNRGPTVIQAQSDYPLSHWDDGIDPGASVGNEGAQWADHIPQCPEEVRGFQRRDLDFR